MRRRSKHWSDIARLVPTSVHLQVHAELQLEVPVDHGLLLENLLDLAHAPFTHTTTFAKGWPVPDAVKFKAAQLLGGNWEPYPIDMSFEPSCMVLSTIGEPPHSSLLSHVQDGGLFCTGTPSNSQAESLRHPPVPVAVSGSITAA